MMRTHNPKADPRSSASRLTWDDLHVGMKIEIPMALPGKGKAMRVFTITRLNGRYGIGKDSRGAQSNFFPNMAFYAHGEHFAKNDRLSGKSYDLIERGEEHSFGKNPRKGSIKKEVKRLMYEPRKGAEYFFSAETPESITIWLGKHPIEFSPALYERFDVEETPNTMQHYGVSYLLKRKRPHSFAKNPRDDIERGEEHKMGDIYEQMMRLDVEVAHHESDLYVPVTPDTERILKAHGMDPRKMKFRDNVTGKPWFDIPFAYTPFYRMRSSKTHPINTSFAKNPRNDYDAREMSVLVKRIQELDKLPLAERKENAAELLDAMQDDLNLIGERLIWLLQGAYGHAEYVKAHEIRKMSKRANRAAQIMQLLAALEWMVPPRLTIATWKKLTKTQQKSLDAMLLEELDGEDWDNE